MSHEEKSRPSCFTTADHHVASYIVGSFSNDDSDGKEDVKKAIGLLLKTTTLHVHQAFLYISLPSLHDYYMKVPKLQVLWRT